MSVDRKKQIMLIDDNQITLRSVGKALEMNGYHNHQFCDPVMAVQNYDEEKYSVIVTDYRMPKMNGLDVLSSIRSKNRNAKFIIYTGFPDDALDKKIAQLGADSFYKPLNIERLINRLEEIHNNNEEEK